MSRPRFVPNSRVRLSNEVILTKIEEDAGRIDHEGHKITRAMAAHRLYLRGKVSLDQLAELGNGNDSFTESELKDLYILLEGCPIICRILQQVIIEAHPELDQ